MAEKKRKKTSLGWFFWLAFILLVALLFFVNKNNIASVLDKTNAKAIFQKSEEQEEEKREVDISVIQDEIEKINSTSSDKNNSENKTKKTEVKKAPKKNNNTKDDKKTSNKKSGTKKTTKKADKKPEKKTQKKTEHKKTAKVAEKKNTVKPVTTKPKTNKTQSTKAEMTATMYFIKIGADGQIIRKAVNRKVAKTDSPMSTVLKSLLRGASLSESKKGYRSFIPPNTRLLSATVKNGVAIINLSEEFQFNQYGIEAYQEQLAQIVLTACEFPTVDSVQFLIQGEKKNYLGGEGVWIGNPLTPASF